MTKKHLEEALCNAVNAMVLDMTMFEHSEEDALIETLNRIGISMEDWNKINN